MSDTVHTLLSCHLFARLLEHLLETLLFISQYVPQSLFLDYLFQKPYQTLCRLEFTSVDWCPYELNLVLFGEVLHSIAFMKRHIVGVYRDRYVTVSITNSFEEIGSRWS